MKKKLNENELEKVSGGTSYRCPAAPQESPNSTECDSTKLPVFVIPRSTGKGKSTNPQQGGTSEGGLPLPK